MKKLTLTLAALLVAAPLSVVGAGAAAAQPAAPDTVFPVEASVIDQFRWSDTWGAPRSGGRTHLGVDILGPKHLPLVAVESGTISFSEFDNQGNWLQLTGDSGWRYRYIHLNNDTPGTDDGNAACTQVFTKKLCDAIPAGSNRIDRDTRVEAGEIIGYNGDSGNAEFTSAHLHFEVAYPTGDGSYQSINPTPIVDAALDGTRLLNSVTAAASDIDSTEAQVARLYRSFFGRIPDQKGLVYWKALRDSGDSLEAIAGWMTGGPEFLEKFENFTNRQYVSFLYNSVLDRPADDKGMTFWLDELSSGAASRSTIVVYFAESPEMKRKFRSRTEAVTAYRLIEGRMPTTAELEAWKSSRNSKTLQQTVEALIG